MVGGHHDRLPAAHGQPADRVHHRERAGHRPDRAHPGVGPGPHDQARAGDLGPRRLRRLLQGVHPPRLPGRPLRAGARAAGLPLPPVDVQRAQRRGAPVRAGAPAAAAAAALLRRRRATCVPGPATTRPSVPASGSGPHERRPRPRPSAAPRQAMGPYGQVGKVVDELDDRLGRGQGRPRLPRQDLPGPLVLHAGRDRAVLVRRPAGHRGLPVALLRPVDQPGHLPRQLQAARRPVGLGGLPLDGRASPSTCAAACWSARCTTGRPTSSSGRSSCTWPASSSPGPSASRASSTGSSASPC